MSDWITRIPHPDEKQREAVQGEFFAAESIKNEAQALVREGIQNSLDAAVVDPVTNKKKPKVRIYTSGKTGALSWDNAMQIFGGAWPHYEAENSGLVASERPSRGTPCEFLVFEDFGTTGLTGDMAQNSQPSSKQENSFYYYLRAEGQSGKADSDRGRWGIGKFVFPKASRIRSFLALTKRSDDGQTVVTGQFILKWHAVDGQTYSPDGWFGYKNEHGVLMPSTDAAVIENFRRSFRIARADEPGLSLVVPWCRKEINRKMLVQAVLRDFYYPILRGQLEVEVADAKHTDVITRDTFDDVFREHRRDLTSDEVGTIELAQEATANHGFTAFRALALPSREPAWSDEMLEEETKASMRRLLDAGNLVSIRVPIWVHKIEGSPERSEIHVWMKRDDTATAGRPVFIRDGLVIPAAHSSLSRGFRSLVLIEDKPIAKLLGDAENPSHTKWDAKSEHFQGKYPASKGAKTITFVRVLVSKLVEAVTRGGGEKDLTTLADVFKAPPQPGQGKGSLQIRGGKPRIVKPKIPVVRPAKLWHHSKLTGKDGFAIYSSGEDINQDKILTIGIGYDVVRGNPIRRWSEYDFTLEDPESISVTMTGTGIDTGSVKISGNRVTAKITNNDFRFEFGGFDSHRDVFMDARMKDAD